MKDQPSYFSDLRRQREESKSLERSLEELSFGRENLKKRIAILHKGIGYAEGFIASGHWTPLRQETPGILKDQIALCEDQLRLLEEEFSEKINLLLSLDGSHHFKKNWMVQIKQPVSERKDQD